jgi:NAD(P)-dependent dehydrogenase (short-subunit alcohol dehydrogenase family)
MASSSVVFLTGASSGLGRVTAERLARAGHRVWATMRSPDDRNAKVAGDLRALAQTDNLPLQVLEADVRSTESVNAAVARVLEAEGHIDVLVNNAGAMYAGIAEGYSAEQLAEQLDTNLVGAFRVVKAVLPSMRARRSGLLIHTSSVYGRVVSPFCGIYHASKFGLEGLMQALAYEVHSLGIDSVLLEPGPFRTAISTSGPAPADAAVMAEYGPVTGALKAWGKGFGEFMAQPLPQTDPALVAEAVLELVALPAGQRPLRKVVGLPYGCDAYNDAVAPIERAVLDGAQLGFLTTRS